MDGSCAHAKVGVVGSNPIARSKFFFNRLVFRHDRAPLAGDLQSDEVSIQRFEIAAAEPPVAVFDADSYGALISGRFFD